MMTKKTSMQRLAATRNTVVPLPHNHLPICGQILNALPSICITSYPSHLAAARYVSNNENGWPQYRDHCIKKFSHNTHFAGQFGGQEQHPDFLCGTAVLPSRLILSASRLSSPQFRRMSFSKICAKTKQKNKCYIPSSSVTV